MGALEVTFSAPQAGDSYIGGIAVSPDRQIRVSTSVPERFDQGRGLLNDGSLCVSLSGTPTPRAGEPVIPLPIDHYVHGLPVVETGALKCQVNLDMNEYDTFVGGIRVGLFDGIFLDDSR
jgi:hypothetical protein